MEKRCVGMFAAWLDTASLRYYIYSILQLTGTLASRIESARSPGGQLLCGLGAGLLQNRSGAAGAAVAHKVSPHQHPLSGDPGERAGPAEGAGAPPQAGRESRVRVLSCPEGCWVPITTS